MKRASLVYEIVLFLRENKKFWMMPIIGMLLFMGLLLVLAQGSALAPFIYTLF
jgi:hypothetical protein